MQITETYQNATIQRSHLCMKVLYLDHSRRRRTCFHIPYKFPFHSAFLSWNVWFNLFWSDIRMLSAAVSCFPCPHINGYPAILEFHESCNLAMRWTASILDATTTVCSYATKPSQLIRSQWNGVNIASVILHFDACVYPIALPGRTSVFGAISQRKLLVGYGMWANRSP